MHINIFCLIEHASEQRLDFKSHIFYINIIYMSKNHDDFLYFRNKYIKYKKKYIFEKQKGGMFWRTKKKTHPR